ncbi:MAG: T9SS type A sorting domain-containing protein [Flavobacteriales bacterium]|nr:T9SS type A sorting domain-containing protein [Flavobacteriales bacterium]
MKKSVLIGSLSVVTLGAGLMCSTMTSKQEGAYHERTSNLHEAATANLYLEEMYRMKGDFSGEKYQKAASQFNRLDQNRSTMSWIDKGPDNIGGRTRAIVVDKDDINHLWAGSVSGGLFESNNRAGTWKKVETFTEELGVSSMCQTPGAGQLFVSTGHQREGSITSEGSGSQGGASIYKQLADGTFELISGTNTYSYVNELKCDTLNDIVWYVCSNGLFTYNPATDEKDNKLSGAVTAMDISPDGQVIVAAATGFKTHVSTNGGASFTDVSGTDAGQIISGGVGRIEYAISKEKVDGKYQIYASLSTNGGLLKGVWRSTNDGSTWEEIAPENNGDPGSLAPFTSGGSGQGNYNNIITVVPGAPERILLGGIDVYSWASTGNWTQVSQWFLHPTNFQYVHADNHEMVWDDLGRLYIGNDGGISYSDNAQYTTFPTFVQANRGYNVTQFYHSSFSAHGDVIGGAQDNGTTANYHTGTTWQEHKEVSGGDGFGCAMSFINRNILFSTIYFSSIERSNDRGNNMLEFYPEALEDQFGCNVGATDGTGCGQFNTKIKLWEDPNDENSEDSISYIPSQGYSAGEIIEIPSATSQTFIEYETPTDVVYDDTVNFDPSETTEDTVITTIDPGATEYNLDIVNYTHVYGGPAISDGDSLYLIDLDTTIVIASWTTIDHYWATNPLRPGKIYDMGNEPQDYNVPWDTLLVQDHYQSWFALGVGGTMGVWMTRNALRFSAEEDNWIKVMAEPSMGTVSVMEFSRDGDHLFVGTYDGQLWRLSGFNDVYSPVAHDPTILGFEGDSLIDYDRGHYATTIEEIGTFPGPVLGLAPGPIGDPDHLVVTIGGSSGQVRESVNATGASVSFGNITPSSIGGEPSIPISMPYYSAVIDRDDPSIILVGTEFGVILSEDGGSSWTNCSGDFGKTPVYDMGQNWRTYDEGCIKPGSIYIGTHGRGIWSTDAYLNLPTDQDNLNPTKFIPNINIYPNPMQDNGTIEFDLQSDSDVTVQIFNLQGQMVRVINEKGMSQGKNNLTFGASDLPSGTYIVRLSAGEMVETSKFIKH